MRKTLLILSFLFLTAGFFAFAEETVEKPEVKGSHKVTFIEIGADNCIPCRMMKPIMEEVENEYPQVKVVFIDVMTPKGRLEATNYRVRSIPTQVFLDSLGNEYFRHVGFFPKDELVEVLKKGGVK